MKKHSQQPVLIFLMVGLFFSGRGALALEQNPEPVAAAGPERQDSLPDPPPATARPEAGQSSFLGKPGSSRIAYNISTNAIQADVGKLFGESAPPYEVSELLSWAEAKGIALPHPLCIAIQPELIYGERSGACPEAYRSQAVVLSLDDDLPTLSATYPIDDQTTHPGSSSYTVAGLHRGQLIVRGMWSGGGSGEFYWGGKLSAPNTNSSPTDFIAAIVRFGWGDRCNGGLMSMELSSESNLQWTSALTAHDLLQIKAGTHEPSQVRTAHLADMLELEIDAPNPKERAGDQWRPYQHISACARCCVGFESLNYNLENDRVTKHLVAPDRRWAKAEAELIRSRIAAASSGKERSTGGGDDDLIRSLMSFEFERPATSQNLCVAERFAAMPIPDEGYDIAVWHLVVGPIMDRCSEDARTSSVTVGESETAARPNGAKRFLGKLIANDPDLLD